MISLSDLLTRYNNSSPIPYVKFFLMSLHPILTAFQFISIRPPVKKEQKRDIRSKSLSPLQ